MDFNCFTTPYLFCLVIGSPFRWKHMTDTLSHATSTYDGICGMLQNGCDWNRCVGPKALGAINMDLESRNLLRPLDVFVAFSSAVVETGNTGKLSPKNHFLW